MKTTGTLEVGNSFHNVHGVIEILPTTPASKVAAFIRQHSCMMQDCSCASDYARIDMEPFYRLAMENGELGINGLQEAS